MATAGAGRLGEAGYMIGTLSVLLTAGGLGIAHAIEPDHVAGITSVTGGEEGTRRSATIGAAFAVGHVVLVATWVGAAYLVLQRMQRKSFPTGIESVGITVSGVVLAALGTAMAVQGLRTVVHRHLHLHEEHDHEHLHTHLPLLDGGHEGHDHTAVGYLKTGLVGALFTLSPPVSMMAFISVVLPNVSPATVLAAILVYGAGITAAMGLVGAGVGSLFHRLSERGELFHAYTQVAASMLVIGIGAHLLAGNLPALL